MNPVRLVLLWHQHQPYYNDMVQKEYRLPWVRLHAIKDYYGMARIAGMVPEFHHQINLVPSLIVQIQAYADGTADDPWLRHARIPADSLQRDQAMFIIDHFFMAQWDQMIRRYPRYGELLEIRRFGRRTADRALKLYDTAALRDLQIWSILTWFHETAREDFPEIRALFEKGRDFSEDDKAVLLDVQKKVVASVIPMHRELMEAGIVEITTTPFYHPILPLLCNMESARRAMPWCPMPDGWTSLTEDADQQLARAVELYQQVFGTHPKGMWPSEGSVSEAAAGRIAKNGLRWIATDEEILDRSLEEGFRNADDRAGKLYRPYVHETEQGPLHLIFRDHGLSDLIGFKYFNWNPNDAAADLLRRVRESGQAARAQGVADPMVSIILDGENCWEHYPNNGIDFLLEFYRLAAKSSDIQPVRVIDEIEAPAMNPKPLNRIFPGSWINHDFYIWIGHADDRKAWEYVFRVREDLVRFSKEVTAFEAGSGSAGRDEKMRTSEWIRSLPEAFQQAWEELYIAEGSDWYWWYGDDRTSGNDEEFDRLFRTHLKNVYTLLGKRPPLFLDIPVISTEQLGRFEPPRGILRVNIDGRTTSYFEWMGAGTYESERDGGVMAESGSPVVAGITWGFDLNYFFIRLTFHSHRLDILQKPAEFILNFISPQDLRITIRAEQNGEAVVLTANGEAIPDAKAAWRDVLEARIPFRALEQTAGDEVEFALETKLADETEEILPRRFLLTYTVPGEDYEASNWW